MEDKWIKVLKNWPELTSVSEIQVFISFANFYRRFIWGFSKIASPFISLLKTIELSEKLASKAFKTNDNKILGGISASRANKTVKNSSKSKKLKKQEGQKLDMYWSHAGT